ncbi:MAG: hypothetical protein HOP95_03690 [Sphingomonas sp.]|nr:hypothetical protein [Sphingomonas sp.]
MSKFVFIAVALLAVPAPLFAQIVFQDDLTKFTPTKADKNKSDLDKLVCRSQDVLGSRLERHQVCLTKEQWFSYEQEAKQRVYDWQRIGLASH